MEICLSKDEVACLVIQLEEGNLHGDQVAVCPSLLSNSWKTKHYKTNQGSLKGGHNIVGLVCLFWTSE